MDIEENDDEARRQYWSNQMEDAFGFMNEILKYPMAECGEPLVSLPEAAVSEGVPVVFSETLIAGRHRHLFFLREGLIHDFLAAAEDIQERGWILKVEDGFRSRDMQKDIALQEKVLGAILKKVVWEVHGAIPSTELIFRRLTALSATCPKIGTHMSGSAIDVSVLRFEDRSEVDRGGPYIEMSELTPMGSPFISAEATGNRTEISEIMRRHGFVAYPYEFWHYSKGDAYAGHLDRSGKPARYGPVDADLSTGEVTPIPNAGESLHSMTDFKRHIESALDRMKNLNKESRVPGGGYV